MTDPGDEKLSRRYRSLASEEPPAHADAEDQDRGDGDRTHPAHGSDPGDSRAVVR